MRTRVVGSESSPGVRAASGQRSPGVRPAEHSTELLKPRVAEQQLSSGIPRYSGGFSAPSDAEHKMTCVFAVDGQGKYFSRGWLEFRGSTAEQERGVGWRKGVHPEDLDRCITSLKRAIDRRESFHLKFRVIRAHGSYAKVLAHGIPQYLLDGSFRGQFCWFEEIGTENSGSVCPKHGGIKTVQEARQALYQIAESLKQSSLFLVQERTKDRKRRPPISNKGLLKCLEISVTPMVVVDKNRQVVYCNSAFRTFAASALDIATPAVMAEAAKCFEDAGQSSSTRENSVHAMNLVADLHAQLDSDPLANDDIRISVQQVTINGKEFTALSVIDIGRERRTRVLERVFLHDLVNAAGGIQILLDLLTTDASRQEQAEYVNLLQASIKRLLSEISHEKMILESSGSKVSTLNVRKVFETLAEFHRNHTFGRNCIIEIDKGVNESFQLLIHQTLLVRVLDHILRNVVEANSQGGVVMLGCRQIDGEIELWIHNPMPLSENARAKIFTQICSTNERAGNARNQDTQLLSELCGGKVSFSSSNESGTTFSIRCPGRSREITSQQRYRTKTAS